MKVRAPRAMAEYYKSIDPDTMVTENFIRKLMKNGDIPVIHNGKKTLSSIEAVDAYLIKHLGKDL